VSAKPNSLKHRVRNWKIIKVNDLGMSKLQQGKDFWQRVKYARLYSDLLQAL